MDWLRSCYSTDMQFDLAGTIVGKVKWYWCRPGAKVFPYQNSFSSDNWITPANSTLGLGEVWNSPRPWRNGSILVVPPGDGHVCGDISWFTDGCPSDAPPLPRSPSGLALCCSTGGLLLGGGYRRRFGGGILLGGDYIAPTTTCQPFVVGQTYRLFDTTEGVYWTLDSGGSSGWRWEDPLNTLVKYDFLPNAIGTCPGVPGHASSSCEILISGGFRVVNIVSFNVLTNTGTWQVIGTAPGGYADRIFTVGP